MKAFVDSEISRDELLDSIQYHIDNDQFVQGLNQYWDVHSDVGCGVGCVLHDFVDEGADHGDFFAFKKLFGLEPSCASVMEFMFERCPEEEAAEWPLRLIKAIPEGFMASNEWWSNLYRWMVDQVSCTPKPMIQIMNEALDAIDRMAETQGLAKEEEIIDDLMERQLAEVLDNMAEKEVAREPERELALV